MIGGGIAPMTGESVQRIFPVDVIHDPVTRDLCQDACGGDAETDAVTPDEGRLNNGNPFGRKSVDKGMKRRMATIFQSLQSPPHGQMGRPEDVQTADFLRACLGYEIENIRVRGEGVMEFHAPLMGEFLGIIQSLQAKPLRKDDCGGDNGSCQRPSARLIHTRHGSNPPGVKFLLVEKRRAPFFCGALFRMGPATLCRHRALSGKS